MTQPEKVTLSSDAEIALATSRLLRFCCEEYDYYDGLPPSNANQIEPIDVLATLSVNSYITNAARIRQIHRGMVTNCALMLSAIPSDTDLLTCSTSTIVEVESLLHAAVQVPYVLIPVATKILHRKRPSLIPMLDNIVIAFYLKDNRREDLLGRTQDKRYAASVAKVVLQFFCEHLKGLDQQIEIIQRELAKKEYFLTPVRILEILVWIAAEERGYYRDS